MPTKTNSAPRRAAVAPEPDVVRKRGSTGSAGGLESRQVGEILQQVARHIQRQHAGQFNRALVKDYLIDNFNLEGRTLDRVAEELERLDGVQNLSRGSYS